MQVLTPEDFKYIDSLRRHLEKVSEAKQYATRTFDSLVILICGGGTYAVLESIKFSFEHPSSANHWLLKAAGICFLVGMISNFASQLFSSRAHTHEEEWIEKEIYRVESSISLESNNANEDELRVIIDLKKLDSLVGRNNKLVTSCNVLSVTSILLGLGLIISYFSAIF